MRVKVREALERATSQLAARQHGIVTREQLLGLGMTRDGIHRRLRDGRLRRLYRGVYLVGPIAPPHAYATAAVFACGDGAVLSHRSAAHVWELLPYPAHQRMPHVTVAKSNVESRRGIRVHRVTHLDHRDVTRRHRIPIVTPPRALLDLAAVVGGRELERALAEAHARRLVTDGALDAVLARNGRRAGTGKLRAVVHGAESPALTRSDAEERLLELIRASDLPHPEVNVRLGPYEVDFLWREAYLVVEVDGYRFHSSRLAFERDRHRDAELHARGYRVIRVTWRQLVEEPEAVIARLGRALAPAA